MKAVAGWGIKGAAAFTLYVSVGLAIAEPKPEALWANPENAFKVRAIDAEVNCAEANCGRSAPKSSTPALEREIEQALGHASKNYAGVKLRPSQAYIKDGKFQVLYVDKAGNSTAVYGPAKPSGDFVFRPHIAVTEQEAFGVDLKVYPYKGHVALAHELFHSVVGAYSSKSIMFERDAGEGTLGSKHKNLYSSDQKWITEGLTEAIGSWAMTGFKSSFASEPYDYRKAFKSGSERYGKVLGLRPYDHPLHNPFGAIPPLKIKPQLYNLKGGLDGANQAQAAKAEMVSYLTSSYWRFFFEESLSRTSNKPYGFIDKAVAYIPEDAGPNRSVELINWAHEIGEKYHPLFKRGLVDSYPAFIAHWVAFPDKIMKSRRGVFKHPEWLDYAFASGCQLVEMNEQNTSVKFTIEKLPRLGANCLRVKWTGKSYAESGWPAMNIVASDLSGNDPKGEIIESLNIGVRGIVMGADGFKVQTDKTPSVKYWFGKDLQPLHPKSTDGEAVLTFTNVHKTPSKTLDQSYRVHLYVLSSALQGEATKPAEPAAGDEPAKPASAARVNRPKKAHPALARKLSDSPDTSTFEVSSDLAEDCMNSALKFNVPGNFNFDDERFSAIAQPIANSCVQMQSETMAAARSGAIPKYIDQNVANVAIQMPPLEPGYSGKVDGATARVSWVDARVGSVTAETDRVNLNVVNKDGVLLEGAYTAVFDKTEHGVDGRFSGRFTMGLVAEEFQPLTDPLDHVSSDMRANFAMMGLNLKDLRKQADESRGGSAGGPTSQPAPSPGSSILLPPEDLAKCPTSCDEMRKAPPSEGCRASFGSLYDSCLAKPGLTDAEVREAIDWFVKDMPSPMKEEMRKATIEQLMGGDPQAREMFVKSIRDAQAASR